jgi:DNA-directed RNA polymerase subunit RPC12/RpoP
MPREYIPWVIGLLLVGIGIVLLNDKIKQRGSKGSTRPKSPVPQKSPTSYWALFASIAAGTLIVAAMFDLIPPDWLSIIPIGLAVLLVLGLAYGFRKLIWACMKSLVTSRSFPRVIRQNENGTMETTCPRCSHKVMIERGHKGESAFRCENCGETTVWNSELKP